MSIRTLTVVALAGVAMPAMAQSIMNPSYEVGPVTGGWMRVGFGSSAIEGWTVDRGNIDHIGSLWLAAAGGRSIELNGNAPGRIYQRLDTIPGAQYVVDFAMSGNWGGWLDTKSLRVTAGDESALYTVYTRGNNGRDMHWSQQQFTFTADADSTYIRFASQNYGKWGVAVDDIRITLVPAPSAGLALLGGLAMRRRRR